MGSILQYFRPPFSYRLSLRSLFCLYLSGRFTQVLLFAENFSLTFLSWLEIISHFVLSSLSNGHEAVFFIKIFAWEVYYEFRILSTIPYQLSNNLLSWKNMHVNAESNI